MAEDELKAANNDDVQLETDNSPPQDASDGELTADDLGGNWLKNPPVGEQATFTIRSIKKNYKDLDPINPKNQKKMKTALSGTDHNIHVHTVDGKVFTIGAWEVWGKLKAIWNKLNVSKQPGFTMANQEVRIKHLLNGLLDENKEKDCYEVAVKRDGKFFTLDRKSNEWKEAV